MFLRKLQLTNEVKQFNEGLTIIVRFTSDVVKGSLWCVIVKVLIDAGLLCLQTSVIQVLNGNVDYVKRFCINLN